MDDPFAFTLRNARRMSSSLSPTIWVTPMSARMGRKDLPRRIWIGSPLRGHVLPPGMGRLAARLAALLALQGVFPFVRPSPK